jgi:hypothetical protein
MGTSTFDLPINGVQFAPMALRLDVAEDRLKTFYVEAGYEARHRGVWYGPGILVILEDGEGVDVFATSHGRRDVCIGTYAYAQLDPTSPPQGLRANHVSVAA